MNLKSYFKEYFIINYIYMLIFILYFTNKEVKFLTRINQFSEYVFIFLPAYQFVSVHSSIYN